MACASRSAPVPVAPTAPRATHVVYGINDGFHGPLPALIVAHDCDGGDLTIRTPQLGAADLAAFLDSIASCPTLHTIALIEAPDAALAFALATTARDRGVRAMENGNELELAPRNLTPVQYADAQAAMAQAERSAGYTGDVIMGGVYALTDETKQAIVLALARCAGCLVGVHLYDPTPADVDWLNALHADIALTETGSPTGCGTAQWQAQADYVAGVRDLALGIARLKYLLVYQRPSGPTCDNLATFGVQAFDGTWKPLDARLRQWSQ